MISKTHDLKCVKALSYQSLGHLVFVALFMFLSISIASAQITFEIGISREKATQKMLSQGYTQIEILRKGFKTIQARACQQGSRYNIRISDGYRIQNLDRVGSCRRNVSMETLQDNLENNGFTRVVMDHQNGNFIAIACRNENRFRIVFSRQGEVLQRRKVGQCQDIFEPNDVRRVLRDAGYNRIKFIDRQLPWYRAEACKNGRKLELLLTRFGDVRKTTRIGKCSPPLAPDRIVQFLEEKGYDRVRVINDQLPIYEVAACFESERLDLELNRFGKITSRKVTGKCRDQMSEEQITELLEKEGFSRIVVRRQSNGQFKLSACFEGIEKFATLSQYGELIRESNGKKCSKRTVSDIQELLTDRGMRNVKFFAEGCRRGRQIRIYFNENGDRIGRERLGSC